jgi:hypothetical protein
LPPPGEPAWSVRGAALVPDDVIGLIRYLGAHAA